MLPFQKSMFMAMQHAFHVEIPNGYVLENGVAVIELNLVDADSGDATAQNVLMIRTILGLAQTNQRVQVTRTNN